MVEICQALNKNGKTGHMTSSGYTWAEQGINSRVLWLQFIKRSKRWGVESRHLNCPMNDSQGRLASSRYITRCTVESCALQIFHSSTMLHSLIRLQYKTSINPPTSASDIEIPTPTPADTISSCKYQHSGHTSFTVNRPFTVQLINHIWIISQIAQHTLVLLKLLNSVH